MDLKKDLIEGYKKTRQENLKMLKEWETTSEFDHVKKWEISIIALKYNGSKFKVTRRFPEMSISETKVS